MLFDRLKTNDYYGYKLSFSSIFVVVHFCEHVIKLKGPIQVLKTIKTAAQTLIKGQAYLSSG